MDKIWDRKSFEVGGHLAVVAGMKKNKWPRRTDKSRTLKTQQHDIQKEISYYTYTSVFLFIDV